MDVADQPQQVGIGIAEDRMIAVLKQMSGSLMAAIERDGVTGEQTAHDRCQAASAGTQQQMKVIGHQRPGQTGGAGFEQQGGEAVAERCAHD